nr:MAG: hypothetical protein [Microvirus sp.]
MKIKTWANASPDKGEVILGVSMTVPDQSISLKILIEKYVRGEPVTTFHAQYDTDNEILAAVPGIERLDAVEKLEAAKAISGAIEDIRKAAKAAPAPVAPVVPPPPPPAPPAVDAPAASS